MKMAEVSAVGNQVKITSPDDGSRVSISYETRAASWIMTVPETRELCRQLMRAMTEATTRPRWSEDDLVSIQAILEEYVDSSRLFCIMADLKNVRTPREDV